MWVIHISLVIALLHIDERMYPFPSEQICELARAGTDSAMKLYGFKVETKCDYERAA